MYFCHFPLNRYKNVVAVNFSCLGIWVSLEVLERNPNIVISGGGISRLCVIFKACWQQTGLKTSSFSHWKPFTVFSFFLCKKQMFKNYSSKHFLLWTRVCHVNLDTKTKGLFLRNQAKSFLKIVVNLYLLLLKATSNFIMLPSTSRTECAAVQIQTRLKATMATCTETPLKHRVG